MSSAPAILCCSTAFLPADSHGGLPYSTFYLCRALQRAGADVRVVTTDRNGTRRLDVPRDCWTTFDSLPVWYATTSSGPFLYGTSAKAAIDQALGAVDCVINSGTLWVHSGWLTWRAAKQRRIPAVDYPRGLLQPWAFEFKPVRKQLYWQLIGRRILRDSAAVVALTEFEAARLRELNVNQRIEVIPNGAALESNDPRPTRAWLGDRYPALSGRRYVLFLGRIHEIKGIDVLLGAAAALVKRNAELAFVVAGPVEPTYEARWRELLAFYELEGKLILTGPVKGPEKVAWLEHATVFVLPSYSEGQPVAALEALQAGCPVVISRACHLPEVERAGAGLTIEPTVDALVASIEALLNDESRRCLMSKRARDLATNTFDWSAIGRRTLELCRAVVAQRRGAPRETKSRSILTNS